MMRLEKIMSFSVGPVALLLACVLGNALVAVVRAVLRHAHSSTQPASSHD
jgi:hypothetical protein